MGHTENPSNPSANLTSTITPTQAPGLRWTPVVGEETLSLLNHLGVPEDSRKVLLQEASSILARCVPPTEQEGQETGLVIGYIQSGKTMSFTTVAALARDNGYRLIIVVSGLTTNLFEQSRRRLEADLRAHEDRLRWLPIGNPRDRRDEHDSISAALGTCDPIHGPRTVLLTVMKNRSHLENLKRLLSNLRLDGVPALVIDDEADQASLNNEVRKGDESPTYRRLVQLRKLLPHHTYLQYTATPQAPLLINLIDVLSPRFAEILTPGSSYTGGKTFFERDLELVRSIAEADIPSTDNILMEPPDSLLAALRVFFLGVAAGRLEGRDNARENRSMMIHPSMRTSSHADYQEWVRAIKRRWADTLAVGEKHPNDPDYLELVDEFSEAYGDLSRTVRDLPALEELLSHLREGISQTIVVEANSRTGRTPEINWNLHYAHILVGGEILSRGFTVEGLTVSYMPRGLGARQADTIQQRARWFGYKEDYLGYCRVYLSDEAINAYRAYVQHEEHMREKLREFCKTGKPLSEWKRVFFLSPELQPTRRMVLGLDYVRGNFSNKWFAPVAPHDRKDAVVNNRELVNRLIGRYGDLFRPDSGDPRRTEDQIHLVATGINLREIYEDFLTKLLFTKSNDAAKFMGVLLQIDKFLECQDENCTIYLMKKGGIRERGVNEKNEVKNLFQGQNPKGVPKAAAIYPGDREIHAENDVTIQIHRLRLVDENEIIEDDVPAVAIWVPRRMGYDWISQPQG